MLSYASDPRGCSAGARACGDACDVSGRVHGHHIGACTAKDPTSIGQGSRCRRAHPSRAFCVLAREREKKEGVQRARNLCASLEPFVAAAFTATIVRLPAFPAARPMTCHACHDVSLYVCESCAAGASTDEPRRKAAAGRCWTSCSMRRSRRSQLEEQRERRERASHGLRMPARLAWLCS